MAEAERTVRSGSDKRYSRIIVVADFGDLKSAYFAAHSRRCVRVSKLRSAPRTSLRPSANAIERTLTSLGFASLRARLEMARLEIARLEFARLRHEL